MDQYTAAAVSAYGATPKWAKAVAQIEKDRDALYDEIVSRGWSARKEDYEGCPVVAVRDRGPDLLIVKSRFEAVAAGFVSPDLG